MLAASFGIETKRQRILKETAVPTRFVKPHARSPSTSGPSTAAPCSGFRELLSTPRSVFAKRERKRVSTPPPDWSIYTTRKSHNNDGHILDI